MEKPFVDLGKGVKFVEDFLTNTFGLKPEIIKYASNIGGIISGIGGIATVAGYFADRNENRKIIGKLGEIIKYLQILDSKIDQIKEQNQEIIQKLDELPSKVRTIVREEVAVALLQERYVTLEAIKLNYFNLPEDELSRYKVHTAGWDRFSEALTYLFSYENRLGKLVDLLNWCEFALVITEYQASDMLDSLVENKNSMILDLFQEVRNNFYNAHNTLLSVLNSQYLKTHNFSNDLNNLDDFRYELADSRQEYYTDVRLICPESDLDVPVPISSDCYEDKTITPDKEAILFNERLTNLPSEIENLKNDLQEKLEFYVNVRDSAVMCGVYRDILKEDKLILNRIASFVPLNNPKFIQRSANGFFIGISNESF